MLEESGTYGYLALAAGVVMLAIAIVAAWRGSRKVVLFQVAAWCLMPILIGYFGTMVRTQQAAVRLSEARRAIPTSELARAAEGYWSSTLVGVLASLPGLTVSLAALAWRARQDRKAPGKAQQRR